jgi:hypothetical protein
MKYDINVCLWIAPRAFLISCKPSNFRKRVRKVINKAKWRGDHRKGSEVKWSKLWLNKGKASWHYVFHCCYCLVYSMLSFINVNLYNCSCEIYIIVVVIICIRSAQCVLYCMCSFVCCVSFDRGVILCVVCCLFIVSYCKPLPPGKNPFAVNKYYITSLHYNTADEVVRWER